jgi:hypothetical protein
MQMGFKVQNGTAAQSTPPPDAPLVTATSIVQPTATEMTVSSPLHWSTANSTRRGAEAMGSPSTSCSRFSGSPRPARRTRRVRLVRGEGRGVSD